MSATVTTIDQLFQRTEPDPERPDELAPGVAEMTVAEFTGGQLDSGVWTCGVGAWDETDTPAAEVMMILEGRVRIDGADGVSVEAAAGDLLHVPAGWSGRWNVLEPVRKVWVIAGTD